MIDEIVNNLQRIADRKCYPEDVLDGSIAQEWVDYIVDLQQENKQLKEDKKKAIEYIKSWVLDEYSIAVIDKKDDDCCYYEPNAREKLLEILGDEENE